MTLAERLLRLVAIPSVIGQEAALAAFLRDRFVAATPAHEVTAVGDSFAARPAALSGRPLVALVGHLDTVPPAGENPPRIAAGRVHGLGAADMKSGLALMWRLVEEPVPAPACDVAFVFYTGEEGPYDGSGLGPLLEGVRWLREEVALAICLEPSDNVVQLGCLGTLHARVAFRGRAAHSARPWQGENAIHAAAPFLARLAALRPEPVDVAGLVYREVISATLAEGGSARNVVPDRFTVNVNYRFAPGRSLAAARRRILDLAPEAEEVAFVDEAPSGPVPVANPLVTRLCALSPRPPAPKQAWTDVARLAAAGIDAVNFGPGESAQAHQPDESTSVALLEEGDAILRRFLAGG